jgi:FkbM family methyltransferase
VATSLARRSLSGLSRVPVRYDGGRSLILADLRTPLGLQLYRYGYRDPDLDLVARLLSPGDLFVDGGANVGLFTLVAAGRVGPSGRVVAFEPGRAVRAQLIENVSLNGFAQVDVMPFALSSAPGEAAFQEFDLGGAGMNHLAPTAGESGRVQTVALVTLDATILASERRRLALIKLDLEGAEHAALRGAGALLADARPDLLLEVEAAHLARMGSSPAAIAETLRGYGYQFYRLTEDHGGLRLSAIADLVTPAASPNVFATVDPDRARRRGILVS